MGGAAGDLAIFGDEQIFGAIGQDAAGQRIDIGEVARLEQFGLDGIDADDQQRDLALAER